MLRRRTAVAVTTLLALLTTTLVATTTNTATAGVPSPETWCSDDPTPPCVVQAFRNGTEFFADDPNWTVFATEFEGPPEPGEPSRFSTDISWNVVRASGGDFYDLGGAQLTSTWSVVLDVGDIIPRVASQYADDVSVNRQPQGAGLYHVRITGKPVTFLNNDDCDTSSWPWTCPETASDQRAAYLGGTITDYGVWRPIDQRDAMYGMNYSTNVEVTSIPPEITSDSTTGVDQLLLRMANSHFHPNGTTVFRGFAHLRIPNQFLREAYGVNDPTAMTSVGLDTTGTGSAATSSITQESGDDAMRVDITDITFSHRLIKVKQGIITPRKPKDVSANRTKVHRGKVRFDDAKSRGSKVTGYRAVCKPSRGDYKTRKGHAEDSPVIVRELREGVGYDCRIRAKSKAGLGVKSRQVHIERRP